MSVKAYIAEKITRKGNDGYTYYRDNHEYCFNLWRDNLFDYLIEYGADDCTNQDCCGQLYVDNEILKRLDKNYHRGRINLSKEEVTALNKMKEHMKKSGLNCLILECY